ncbi:MAG: hypothetical protein ACT4PS_06815 [Betaproteobacteria bacterium]
MRSYTAYLLYGASALLALPAFAQTRSVAADPTHASARVPDMKYDSAFRGYAPYREQPLATWRDLNDEVGRVGGHIGMFGGGGHAGHAGAKASPKPQSGAPAANAKDAAGQPPARSAPAASGGSGRAH